MNNIICHKIIDVTEEGILLESQKERIFICFDDCAKNFSLEKGDPFSRCVATRDITTLSFTFYTQPKTKVVFKKSFLKTIIAGKSAESMFFGLQKAIVEAGYTSYDWS